MKIVLQGSMRLY